MSVDAHDLYKL